MQTKINSIIFFCISIFILCTSCNNSESNIEYVDKFDNQETVVAKDVDWINTYDVSGIQQIDSFLIILNSKGKSAFQIYNTNQKKLVTEVGTFGRGPSEFVHPRLTKQSFKNKEGTFFYLWDETRGYFYTINLEKLISGKDYIEKKENLSKKMSIQTHLIKVDSVLIGSTDMKDGSIFRYQPSTDKLDLWDYYPNDINYENLNTYERYCLYARSWVYNSDKKILVGCYDSYFNQMSFFNLDGDCLKSIKFPMLDYQFNIKTVQDDAPWYVADAIGTTNNIYTSYYESKEMIEEDVKGMINVLSWEGIPLKQYLIQNVLITSFVVDEINNKVYAHAPNNEGSLIVEFDL